MTTTKPDPKWRVAFMEGYEGLTDFEERFRRACEAIGCETTLIEGLYDDPSRLEEARAYDTWSLVTTGVYVEQLGRVVEHFAGMGHLPKLVIFPLGEDNFLDVVNAMDLRGKVEFYRVLDESDGRLIRLTYLDD